MNTFKKVLALATLAAAILAAAGCFSGCSTLAPGADPVEVRAEQMEGVSADTFDLFLHVEYDNVDFCRSNLPAVHAAAEWLRQPVTLGTNVWSRDIAMVQSFDATRRAYKANRTADNKASLTAALAALETALRQVQEHLATLAATPFVQQHSSPAVKAQIAAASAGHASPPAPAAAPVFSPIPSK